MKRADRQVFKLIGTDSLSDSIWRQSNSICCLATLDAKTQFETIFWGLKMKKKQTRKTQEITIWYLQIKLNLISKAPEQ